MNRISTIIILLTCCLIYGCRTDQGTEKYAIDSPWNSTKSKATTIEHTYLNYMASGSSSDLYWTRSSGSKVKVSEVSRKLDKYLLRKGYLNAWPDSGSCIDGVKQKASPYRIFFVSIDPVIVLMVPWNSNNKESSLVEDEMAAKPRQQCSSEYLDHPFEFGTRIPYANELIALHLNKNIERKVKLHQQDDKCSIEFDDVNLRLIRQNTIWLVTRIK